VQAVHAYCVEQARPTGEKRKGVRTIAEEFGIPKQYKTILNHATGKTQPLSEYMASKQKILAAEEHLMVHFLLESAKRGFPLSHEQIQNYANTIIERRKGESFEPAKDKVGHQWIFRFLDRHHNKLQTHWGKGLDTQRAKALNPSNVNHWFSLVEEHITNKDIRPEDIYGMDESGFPLTNTQSCHCVGPRGAKLQHTAGSADRENVTGIVTICADGTALCPTIIFKGQNFMQKWGDNNIAHAL
jgi:hypothetical protein